MEMAIKGFKACIAFVLLSALVGCTTTMTEAERDALMAECQLLDDDDERAACLERLALGEDAVEPQGPVEPVQ